jgi:hypothetical protein
MIGMAPKLRLLAALCVPALTVGCVEHQYYFRPTEMATATLNGYPAARYAIPPESPRGAVRVASYGVVDIQDQTRGEIPALHVLLQVSNDTGATAWNVDARQIRVELRRGGDLGVPLVNAEVSGVPSVEIPTGVQRSIHLFFPLARDMDAGEIPAFDVLWRVQTDTRVVAVRTPFERIEIEQNPAVSASFMWGGSYWWYDPWYYPPAVVVRPTIIASPTAPPPRVIVRRHPR